MDYNEQLERLKVLAGIYKPYKIEDEATIQDNMSDTGTDKATYQKEHNIEPGTPEWFKLWFSRPTMTGENPYGKTKK